MLLISVYFALHTTKVYHRRQKLMFRSANVSFFGCFRPVDGRWTVVGRSSAVPVSSAAPKKKSFDQGGPVWPPRSNAKYDRSGAGVWGAPAKTEKFLKKKNEKQKKKRFFIFETLALKH